MVPRAKAADWVRGDRGFAAMVRQPMSARRPAYIRPSNCVRFSKDGFQNGANPRALRVSRKKSGTSRQVYAPEKSLFSLRAMGKVMDYREDIQTPPSRRRPHTMPSQNFFADNVAQVGLNPDKVQALMDRAERDVKEGILPACQLAIASKGKIAAMATFGAAG